MYTVTKDGTIQRLISDIQYDAYIKNGWTDYVSPEPKKNEKTTEKTKE